MFQLLGQLAFIGASFALGTRLLRLWGRTRQMAELSIGLAFVCGGGFGYLAWIVLALGRLTGADEAAIHAFALGGLVCTSTGAICNGIGNREIYRPGKSWPVVGMCLLAIVMLSGIVGTALGDGDGPWFWVTIVSCAPLYAWGAFEAFALVSTLKKRARIGLADPLVIHRILTFGVASAAVVVTIGIAWISRLANGPVMPQAIGVANASSALVAAVAIWSGFFPPKWLRHRINRSGQV